MGSLDVEKSGRWQKIGQRTECDSAPLSIPLIRLKGVIGGVKPLSPSDSAGRNGCVSRMSVSIAKECLRTKRPWIRWADLTLCKGGEVWLNRAGAADVFAFNCQPAACLATRDSEILMVALLERPITTATIEVDRSVDCRPILRWKRILDLAIVVVSTPLLAPLLGVVSLYIKMMSPGPILFKQSRVGYGGETFTIYKFRTMHVAPEGREEAHRLYVASHARAGSAIHKPEHQNQLIAGGSWIRKLSIDEFPQLLNVFKGNMSIVGPRPDLLQVEDYKAWQLQRFEVLPGMTGLWQISGKNRLTFEEMVNLDIRYAQGRSLLGDLKIIFMTFKVLLTERNE